MELTADRWTYRLVTIADLPFDAFPRYRDGGPATVTVGGWGVSTESLCGYLSSASVREADDGMHTLKVYQLGANRREFVYHELSGTKYATADEASEAAYNAGVLAFMVYDRDAHKYPALVELLAQRGVTV